MPDPVWDSSNPRSRRGHQLKSNSYNMLDGSEKVGAWRFIQNFIYASINWERGLLSNVEQSALDTIIRIWREN
jgi:hypothetical protein